jgi:3-hexulose-6-phosphate synthase/6-phospho-3-hexuloisomerase
VQAVGGLSVEQAIQTWELGAEIVVFGAPLVIRSDRFQAAGDDFEAQLRAIMAEMEGRRGGA